MDFASATSPTLLGRLGQPGTDQAAWAELVRRYGPRISSWCRQWGLQEADAQDVTQTVLARLVEKLRSFHYDRSRGSFRGWLRTLTHHAWYELVTDRRRQAAGGRTLAELDTLPARDDLLRRLEEEFDLELLAEAAARVRLRVAPHIWETYRLLTEEQLSPLEVAERVGLRVALVYKNKSKVQQFLQEEIRRLEGDDSGPVSG
jgi:RNA polymerase sigma-70 factor (ECF subfamily)